MLTNDRITSSVSATSDNTRVIKNNLDTFIKSEGNMIADVPLTFHLNSQMGGSNLNEDSISTEQLESKLRSIFTNVEPIEQNNINQNLNGGGCGDEESHKVLSRGCDTDEEGNPIPHMQGGNDLESLPLIMATQYSDATSFNHRVNTSSNNDDSSTSDSDIVTSNVSSSQLNLIEATQYSDATSFGN